MIGTTRLMRNIILANVTGNCHLPDGYPRETFFHYACTMLFVGALLLTLLAGSAAAGPKSTADEEFRVGFTTGIFPDVDPQDAQVAMQLWTRQLASSVGLTTKAKTLIFTRTEDLLAAVNRGEMTIVSLSAMEYLRIRSTAAMTPALISQNSIGSKRRFLLITRRDSRVRTIRDLRGKTLTLPSRKKYSAGHIWLDVLLLKSGLPDAQIFCGQTSEATIASQAIMGVFFKRSDAAVVSRSALETSIALNPQLGQQLQVLTESPPLLGDLSCITNAVSPARRRAIEQAAVRLHETTTGKQLFTLFQMDRVIPFHPEHLTELEMLLKERERLAGSRKVHR